MAVEKEFYVPLPDGNAIRVRRMQDKGRVLDFVMQLESSISQEDCWEAVARVDTAHGFVHLDGVSPGRRLRKTVLVFGSYDEALTWAIRHFKERWPAYAERFRSGREVRNADE